VSALELFSLRGRRALVTGASRGLGRHVALGLARAGADVALVARDAAALGETARHVEAAGARAIALEADLVRPGEPARVVAAARDALGGLDVLVNNAGTNVRKPALETSDADFEAILRLNLGAAFACARAAAEHMERGARLINIGSVAGHVAIPTGVAYAASKAALAQMTRVLALEWGPRGINVNCVAPWYFRTPLTEAVLDDPPTLARILRATPLGRIGEPDDLVGVVVFLASKAAAYVTGQTIAVDGGMSSSAFHPDA